MARTITITITPGEPDQIEVKTSGFDNLEVDNAQVAFECALKAAFRAGWEADDLLQIADEILADEKLARLH